MVMTRNLIQTILEAVECSQDNGSIQINGELIQPGSDAEHAAYYCLDRKYLVVTGNSTELPPRNWIVKRLTADGHDKLRELRKEPPL